MISYKNNDYLILFANCIPVKGSRRSTICDLQRNQYFLIPNDLYYILGQIKENKLLEIYAKYEKINEETLDSYFNFILDNELGFIDTNPKLFPNLNLDWKVPSKITNSIIEINSNFVELKVYKQLIDDLSSLNCGCVQLRCFSAIELNIIIKLLKLFDDNRINEIRFYLKYDEEIDLYFKNKADVLSKVSSITFFDCKDNYTQNNNDIRFNFLKNKDLDNDSCGNICHYTFNTNIYQFTESQEYNSCLNRKISVDKFGYIKNCPSQKINFGNIFEKSIIEIINDEHFKKLWSIKKDDIKICKDCEFRYICTDCRIFIENDNDVLSKPSKCNYNPYNATWE